MPAAKWHGWRGPPARRDRVEHFVQQERGAVGWALLGRARRLLGVWGLLYDDPGVDGAGRQLARRPAGGGRGRLWRGLQLRAQQQREAVRAAQLRRAHVLARRARALPLEIWVMRRARRARSEHADMHPNAADARGSQGQPRSPAVTQ